MSDQAPWQARPKGEPKVTKFVVTITEYDDGFTARAEAVGNDEYQHMPLGRAMVMFIDAVLRANDGDAETVINGRPVGRMSA